MPTQDTPLTWASRPDAPIFALLPAFWAQANDAVARANVKMRERQAELQAQGHKWTVKDLPSFGDGDATALRDHLGAERPPTALRQLDPHRVRSYILPALTTLAAADGVTLTELLKLLGFFNLLAFGSGALAWEARPIIAERHRREGRPTLRELSTLLVAAGLPKRAVFSAWLGGFANDWPDEHVLPALQDQADAMLADLAHDWDKNYAAQRQRLYDAIGLVSEPPAALLDALYDKALSAPRLDRGMAQRALQYRSGFESRVIAALADGRAERRQLAAMWLGRLELAAAVPALETAVAKEKQDLAKGAMLDALQRLGRPVQRYLNRATLAAEAGKGLAKGLPEELAWFPWDRLPPLHWHDDGSPVPPELPRWFLVQAVKQKLPEPNAVLRKYCEMFDSAGREALALFVLQAWITHDTTPIPTERAMKQAREQARSMQLFYANPPDFAKDDPKVGKSVDELYTLYLPRHLREPAGTAIASKGLLAVVAACGGAAVVEPVQRYLVDWYGTRAAHSKALVAMLAWVDHPAAVQRLLAVAHRFRTKGIQDEATRQIEALAERRGWTVAELADRTTPTAGLDDDGTLDLSYGERHFRARLLPDLKFELLADDGRRITTLPEPRQDDDEAAAREAKKAWTAAKKEVKTIVDLQTERLYDAMCTEREWRAEDWRSYLLGHPVLRHAVRRLVWLRRADGPQRVFRPLDDGSLSDSDDNSVDLPDDARVLLAHDCHLDDAAVAAWQQHLKDYKVTPLFQQFGKGRYSLPAAQVQETELKAFEGHVIEAFKLRNQATKLGWLRGPAEDGGRFYSYGKRFASLGLEAEIRFSGNDMPEQNRPVALLTLSVLSSAASAWQRQAVRLGELPPVLLAECRNDLRLIAAQGSGFDADWATRYGD